MQSEPPLADGSGIVQPVTDEERAATSAFLVAVAGKLDWARALEDRARKTVTWCASEAAR